MSLFDGLKILFSPSYFMGLFTFWMDGGGGSNVSTSYTSNVPEWMAADQKGIYEATKRQIFDVDEEGNILRVKPYVPYSANPEDYVAGLTDLQEQALTGIANLSVPGEYQRAANLAERASSGALDSASKAYRYGDLAAGYGARGAAFGDQAARFGAEGAGYGRQAAGYGAQGLRYGEKASGYGDLASRFGAEGAGYGRRAADLGMLGLQERDMASGVSAESRELARQQAGAGERYAQLATDQAAVGEYMSPYVQNVINQQKNAAIRDHNIQRTYRRAQAARSGAYGGARQAIMEAEAERALNSQLQGIEATGLQSAYDRAIQSLQFGSTTGMQGLSGAQSGLSTALSGGQLGLQGIQSGIQGAQAGMQGAETGMRGAQAGIQGAQAGMQGVQTGIQGAQAGMQGAQTGIQGAQAGMQGAQTGIQGAQAGLQGVAGAQAGYSTAAQGAGQLANVGQGQTQAALNILGAQTQAGAMEQQQDQNVINQAVQNYATAAAFPQEQLGYTASLINSTPSPGSVTRQYQPSPSVIGTAASLGTAAMGAKAANLFREGGIVNLARGGVVMGYAEGGDVTDIDNVERIAQDLSPQQLQQSIQNKTLPEYIGIPLLAQKQQEQQRMQAAQAAQQAPQGIATIKDRIMQGVDALPSNLPAEGMAGGGIVAFAAGGDMPRRTVGVGGVTPFPLEPEDLRQYDLTPYESEYKQALNPATGKPYTEEEISARQTSRRESRGIKDIYGDEIRQAEERLNTLPSEEKEMMGYAIMAGAFEAMASGSPDTARYLGNLGASVSKNAAGVKREFKALSREARKEKQALKIAQDQAARADMAGDEAAFDRAESKRQSALSNLTNVKNKVVDQANDVLAKGRAAEYDFLVKQTIQSMENAGKIRAAIKNNGLDMVKVRNSIYTNTVSEFEKTYGSNAIEAHFKGNEQAAKEAFNTLFQQNLSMILNGVAETPGQSVELSASFKNKGPNVVAPKVDSGLTNLYNSAKSGAVIEVPGKGKFRKLANGNLELISE